MQQTLLVLAALFRVRVLEKHPQWAEDEAANLSPWAGVQCCRAGDRGPSRCPTPSCVDVTTHRPLLQARLGTVVLPTPL